MADIENIDSVITYIVLKKLMTVVSKTPAFKLKLVDNAGKVIKQPETDEEKKSLTLLDKFIFKVRRLLGNKLSLLHAFLYLQSANNEFYQKLIVKGNAEQKAEIKRIKRDIEKVAENYNSSVEDILKTLIVEDVK